MNNLSILDIVRGTTVDGPGFRTSIYGAGCTHKCKGCHNPQSWDEDGGNSRSIDDILAVVKQEEFSNVTFSGGDPLMQIEGFTELAKRIKKETSKNIWCYTGYIFEHVVHSKRLSKILPYIDVLVDGRYMEALHDSDLQFRGSSNQRIVDVQRSLKAGEVVLWRRKAVLVV
ncbi:MAG: anaerobic ribonucleoside-triphosphate reductase activating protein [Bacteroidales bacterium]